jgi:hypothetical protein
MVLEVLLHRYNNGHVDMPHKLGFEDQMYNYQHHMANNLIAQA